MFVGKNLVLEIMINCGTSEAIKLGTKLGSNQQDLITI